MDSIICGESNMVDIEQIRNSRMSRSSFSVEHNLKTRITNLRRTIQFLQDKMEEAKRHIDNDPDMAKLIINDALNDKRFKRS
jgi:hypothetical protein